ncbi:MAG: phage recombination protein Bet [Tepidisphaeraceae bacterium]
MTVALAPANGVAIVQWGMTRDQLDLIKRTIAQGTNDDEFALFMTTAQRLGLDPFAKQIYAVKRPSFDRERREYIDKMTIQVGIDGFRSVADRTGENDGQEGPFWCGTDGKWRDVWIERDPPAGAMVRVYRKECSRPFTGVATFESYAQRTKDGKPMRQWQQMPDVMLAKCAEALALRKAFPSQLSGVYAPEEMAQADNAPVVDSDHRDTQPAKRGAPWDAPLATCKTPEDVIAIRPKFDSMRSDDPRAVVARAAYERRLAELTFVAEGAGQ